MNCYVAILHTRNLTPPGYYLTDANIVDCGVNGLREDGKRIFIPHNNIYVIDIGAVKDDQVP